MRRRRIHVLLAIVLTLGLAACAVPQQRDPQTPSRLAIAGDDVDAVYARYREVVNAAIEVGNPQPLSVVERGSVLNIDTAAFAVGGSDEPTTLRADRVAVPRFTSYPLWFVAVAAAEDGERRVQVFARESAVDTWALVESPAILDGVELPELRTADDATAVTVDPADDRGLALSPQAAVDAYVASLAALPAAPPAGIAQNDGLQRQMRDSVTQNQQLADVEFSQAWTAEPVEHVLRTSDGGALVFATLLRADTFQVAAGRTVTYPEGSVQNALAPEGITGTGTVNFAHQVLIVVPPGSGDLRVIGQFGGVVAVDAP